MTKIKICGLKSADQLSAVRRLGADFAGLVFFPPSPRHINLTNMQGAVQQFRQMEGDTPDFKLVVLTVNPDNELLTKITTQISPDMLQLHGDESPMRVQDIKQKFKLNMIKAISVAGKSDMLKANDYLPHLNLEQDMILFDAKADPKMTELPGGNGLTFDWTLLDEGTVQHPFMLAGGLTPDNITAAIELTNPSAVDVSSGVESEPGEKDLNKVKNFIEAVRIKTAEGK